jgi:streptogramin lyase
LPALTVVLTLIGCASKPAVQQKAAFWPPYPDEPRIQYLTSFQTSSDVEAPRSRLDELVLGKETEQVMGLAKPYGVEMWQGKIYVCDLRSSAVTVLDLRNRRTLVLGRSGQETLQDPSDIAIAPDGFKYVADHGRGAVYVFDPQERLVNRFTHKDLKPVGVAVFQNELYVCDFKGQRVEVLDRRTGQLLRTIGEAGPGEGQFIRPLGIAVDDKGFIYVTDVLKCQMQKFDREGTLQTTFGMISANAGGFVRPKHIAVDNSGIIYVVDAAFQNVQLFDQKGRVYTFFGSAGAHPGAMDLPAGISVHEGDLDLFKAYIHPAFEAERLILVTNQFGDNKVSVYALGKLKQGLTVADISGSKDVVPAGASDPKTATPAMPAPASTQQAPDDTGLTSTPAAPTPTRATPTPAAPTPTRATPTRATPTPATPTRTATPTTRPQPLSRSTAK